MAKVQNILHGEREHDVGFGRYRYSRNIYFFGPALRPFSGHHEGPESPGRNILETVFHRFARCVRGRARYHNDNYARISFSAARAIIPQVRLLFISLQYMRAERMSHVTEIALLVFFPLFSRPGAAGSSSKPGDGMMELALRPKMGT